MLRQVTPFTDTLGEFAVLIWVTPFTDTLGEFAVLIWVENSKIAVAHVKLSCIATVWMDGLAYDRRNMAMKILQKDEGSW